MNTLEKGRSPKQIADTVALILKQVNDKFTRKTPESDKDEKGELDPVDEKIQAHRRRAETESIRKSRDLYVVQLCRENNISIKHIMTVGGFDLDKFEIN